MLYKEMFRKPGFLPKNVSVRLLIVIATCVSIVSVIYIGKTPYGGQPQVGKVADRDIYAPIDFSFNAGIDDEKTAEKKNNAALAIKDVYDIDPGVYDITSLNIKALFLTVRELRSVETISAEEKLVRARSVNKFGLSDGDLKVLLQSSDTEKAEPILLKCMDDVFSQGIISPDERDSLKKQGKNVIRIRNITAKSESDAEAKSVRVPSEVPIPQFNEPAITDNKL
ncbi:MAG: hypothetical protein WC316_03600, partial [Candidatus Omnitrophota bacterium]